MVTGRNIDMKMMRRSCHGQGVQYRHHCGSAGAWQQHIGMKKTGSSNTLLPGTAAAAAEEVPAGHGLCLTTFMLAASLVAEVAGLAEYSQQLQLMLMGRCCQADWVLRCQLAAAAAAAAAVASWLASQRAS
jgi:hypothetical protein